MRMLCSGSCVTLALLASCASATAQSEALDLRRGVPTDAFLAIHHKHNPERDFQRAYYEEVWKTVEETRIIERVVAIVATHLPEADVEKAKSLISELREAASPIDLEAMADCEELVYAQFMQVPATDTPRPPSGQHLLLIRLDSDAAAGCEEGVKNLLGLVEKYSGGQVPVEITKEGDAVITTLAIPEGIPIRPTVVRLGDVILLCSSDELARRSLAGLTGGGGESKFDDPRLQQALGQLPEPEDTLVFYDGKAQFEAMRGMGAFIRQVGQGSPDAERAAGFVEMLFDELSIWDYEVTVEYTEGNLNRTAVSGKLLPGFEDKLLGKVLGSGQPFDEWQTWLPAGALSYSLTTGVNLHPLYEQVMAFVEEEFPEAKPALEQFESLQKEYDVYLDRDILQAFSGECVSVSLPAAVPSMVGGPDSVLALRCRKPDRIRELLHRSIDALQKSTMGGTQQLALTESAELEGFESLSALFLNMFGIRPVIGFHDGWMIVGSSTQAVKTVLDTKAGQGETIVDTEAFKQFNLQIEGPVKASKYTNLAQSTRQIAQALGQVGMIAPTIIGLAGGEAGSEELKPVQEVLGLLPSVARIVSKFDFLEAKLSVTQAGDEPGTYSRRSVVVVRPPATEAPAAE